MAKQKPADADVDQLIRLVSEAFQSFQETGDDVVIDIRDWMKEAKKVLAKLEGK